jgi:hypothetical protein
MLVTAVIRSCDRRLAWRVARAIKLRCCPRRATTIVQAILVLHHVGANRSAGRKWLIERTGTAIFSVTKSNRESADKAKCEQHCEIQEYACERPAPPTVDRCERHSFAL